MFTLPRLFAQASRTHTSFYRNVITMATAATKRKAVQIGTHSGTFHCDEALGCFMLKLTNQFQDCSIVRWVL
jgi:hypothetical protein